MLKNRLLTSRIRAASLHLLISTLIAAYAAIVIFKIWYPGDYRLLSGGQNLFLLLISIDVVLGPFLTFVVFDIKKSRHQIIFDLTIIGAFQLTGLLYGLHTVFMARPVALVFEVDRFHVITASDVYLPELSRAQPQYRHLPLKGPWLLSIREAKLGKERNDALFMAVFHGVDTGQRPTFWQPYNITLRQVIQKSRPIEALINKYPNERISIQEKLNSMNLDPTDAYFLPMIARGNWVVVVNSQGQVRGFIPLDGFFITPSKNTHIKPSHH